jgi:hypothetical protein
LGIFAALAILSSGEEAPKEENNMAKSLGGAAVTVPATAPAAWLEWRWSR